MNKHFLLHQKKDFLIVEAYAGAILLFQLTDAHFLLHQKKDFFIVEAYAGTSIGFNNEDIVNKHFLLHQKKIYIVFLILVKQKVCVSQLKK